MIVIFAPSGNEATPEVSPRAGDSCDVMESSQPEDKEGTDLILKHFNMLCAATDHIDHF